MKFIHISDIHLTAPGAPAGAVDPLSRFKLALADVAENHADAARVIITGDLTHWGEVATYQLLKEVLEDFPLPVRLLLGNHDNRANFCSVFADHPVDTNGYVNHAEDVDAVRFIYLDTLGDRTHAGHFGADRRAWLEDELKSCTRARIFLHHNPMSVALPAEDPIAVIAEDQIELHALLRQYADRIDYFHFGHVHTPVHGVFEGIPFAAVPSTGNQTIPDLNETKWLKGGALDPAYFVVLAEGRNTLMHQIPFAFSGEVGLFGIEWQDAPEVKD